MAHDARRDRPLSLLERLDAAVLALEHDGRVAVANGAASSLFGRPPAELVGRSVQDLLPISRPGAHVELREVTGPDDTRFVAVRDITERVTAQDQLRSGPGRVGADPPGARVGSWEWDIPANEVRWSDQLYRIYGLEPGAVAPTYERFLDYVHPDDRADVDARNRRAFADHQPFQDVKRVIRADGVEIWMRTQGEVICDDAGAPIRMIGVCEDVTHEEREYALLAGRA